MIINAGQNYQVSDSSVRRGAVAIFSKNTGDCVELKQWKKSWKLAMIRRHYKSHLSSTERFYFDFMQPYMVKEIVRILRSQKRQPFSKFADPRYH